MNVNPSRPHRTKPTRTDCQRWLSLHPPKNHPLATAYFSRNHKRSTGNFGEWLHANHRQAFNEMYDTFCRNPELWEKAYQ